MSRRRKIAVADSETDPFLFGRIPKPFVWGYYDGETFERFDDVGALIEFCQDEEQIVFMHNGGKFDFFFMAEHIEEHEPLTVINGRITKFKIGNVEFRDSYAILPVPLSAHDKGEIDYALFEADKREAHMREIVDYLYRDCESLYRFVTRYIDDYGLNLTLAGGALEKWSAMTDTEKPKTSQAFYETFAPFYYGGRVECFESGIVERDFVVADINSAYPYAMTFLHPWGELYDDGSRVLPSDSGELHRSFIHCQAESRGAFPFRDPDTGALTFPNDGKIREFFVTGWEFAAARDTGRLRLIEVLTVLRFFETIEFNSYVSHFFAEKAITKETNDTAGYILAKLHLNSLYGKLGANPAEYEEFITAHPSNIEAMAECYGYDYCEMFGPHAIMARPLGEEKHRFYNVATAASITGFVRAFLWRSICKCKGVLYCDTDSIAAVSAHSLNIGAELGQWEIEAKCDRGAIAGKKLYAFHNTESDSWKVSSKGVRLTADEVWRIAQGETVTHSRDVPTFSLKGGIKFIEREVKMTDT